ncbi:MAG: hypothetical protein ACREMR_04525 [Gemmatimonadales bacterium]
MKLLALLLAIALTAGVGYVSQVAMVADADRFYRLTEGADPAAVWFGGTLPPLVVTGLCETGHAADKAIARRHAAAHGAAGVRSGGTLPAILVTARAPSVRHLATSCGAAPAAHWHVD